MVGDGERSEERARAAVKIGCKFAIKLMNVKENEDMIYKGWERNKNWSWKRKNMVILGMMDTYIYLKISSNIINFPFYISLFHQISPYSDVLHGRFNFLRRFFMFILFFLSVWIIEGHSCLIRILLYFLASILGSNPFGSIFCGYQFWISGLSGS